MTFEIISQMKIKEKIKRTMEDFEIFETLLNKQTLTALWKQANELEMQEQAKPKINKRREIAKIEA
jgi:hypothetical protein